MDERTSAGFDVRGVCGGRAGCGVLVSHQWGSANYCYCLCCIHVLLSVPALAHHGMPERTRGTWWHSRYGHPQAVRERTSVAGVPDQTHGIVTTLFPRAAIVMSVIGAAAASCLWHQSLSRAQHSQHHYPTRWSWLGWLPSGTTGCARIPMAVDQDDRLVSFGGGLAVDGTGQQRLLYVAVVSAVAAPHVGVTHALHPERVLRTGLLPPPRQMLPSRPKLAELWLPLLQLYPPLLRRGTRTQGQACLWLNFALVSRGGSCSHPWCHPYQYSTQCNVLL